MDQTPSSVITEIDRYLAEGSGLIARAEACRQALSEGGAEQGHLLMAARTLRAMHRVQATMLRQREILVEAARTAAPSVIVLARPARPWWPFGPRRKAQARFS